MRRYGRRGRAARRLTKQALDCGRTEFNLRTWRTDRFSKHGAETVGDAELMRSEPYSLTVFRYVLSCVTGIGNVRDVIPFPRMSKSAHV